MLKPSTHCRSILLPVAPRNTLGLMVLPLSLHWVYFVPFPDLVGIFAISFNSAGPGDLRFSPYLLPTDVSLEQRWRVGSRCMDPGGWQGLEPFLCTCSASGDKCHQSAARGKASCEEPGACSLLLIGKMGLIYLFINREMGVITCFALGAL